MQHPASHSKRQTLTCTRCAQEILGGEDYWYINGASVCADCLIAFAREELAPYRHTREEASLL